MSAGRLKLFTITNEIKLLGKERMVGTGVAYSYTERICLWNREQEEASIETELL